MRQLRLFVALTAAAAMMIALPVSASAQETAFGGGSYAAAVAADGAVAHWRLDEVPGQGTAFDETGNNDANYNGAPLKGVSPLIGSGTAVYFDGDNDIAKVPGSNDINLGGPYDERSIELWFNADDPSTRQVLWEEGGGSRGLAMYVQHNRVWMNGWNLKNDDPSTPWGAKWLSAPIEAGTTYHVVMVVNGNAGKIKGWLNGSPIGQITGVGNLFKHQAKVAFGAMHDDVRYHNQVINNPNTNFHFAGTLDEVAIYNTALTGSQISNHTILGGMFPGSVDAADIVSPDHEDIVSGNTLIKVAVVDEDPEGSLTVEYRIDGGEWNSMDWFPGPELYEANWDTNEVADGSHTIQTRAYDSTGASKADSIDVTVDNTGAYGDQVLADGAVAFWRLGESQGNTAEDETGNNDATYMGNPTRGAAGLISEADTAANFDGENDYVAVPNSTDINTGGPYSERTVELWFDADDVNSRQVLFEEGGASRGLSAYLDQGDLYVAGWNTRNDDATTPWGPEWISVPVFAGNAYHLVLVLDASGDLEGFVNGLSFGSVSDVGNLFNHNAAVAIGAMDDDVRFHDGPVTNAGQDYFFDGTIDEVAVYNSALSSSTIGLHTVLGGESVASPPTLVEIEEPSSGSTVSGLTDVWVHATDGEDPTGSLVVQWRIDGGAWNSTTYNGGTDHYEGSWDTTQYADGSYTIEVRVIDSDSAMDSGSHSVNVNNTSAYAAAVLADGPVAYWRFGEASGTTANDEAGSHNETYTNGVTLGASGLLSGDPDTAVDFDGVDDYLPITNASDINTGGPYSDRTIEFWFNADDASTRQVLFEEGGISRGLAVYIYNGELYATAWNIQNDDPTTPWGPVALQESIVANTTYHVAVVLDESGDDFELYVDGVLEDSASGVGNLFAHSANVAIGAMDDDVVFHDGSVTNSGQSYFFNGEIDEFAIYNVSLSSSQVNNHYLIGVGA